MRRGFLIALLIAFGIPILSLLLALSSPGLAMVYAYVVAPLLIHAFPVSLFVPDSGLGGLLASVVLLLGLCFACGWLGRYRGAGVQLLIAIGVFVGWCGLWWLIAQAAGVTPHFDVRM